MGSTFSFLMFFKALIASISGLIIAVPAAMADGHDTTADGPAVEDFQGQVFHAQHWPEALDYTGKRVVLIGSGATAVTLVPTRRLLCLSH